MKSKKNKIKTSVKKLIKKLVKDGLEDLQWPSELGRYQWVEYIDDNDTNIMSIEVSTVTRDENGNLFNEQSFINIYKTCKKKKFKKYLYNDIMYEIFYNYNNIDDRRLYESFIKHIDTKDKSVHLFLQDLHVKMKNMFIKLQFFIKNIIWLMRIVSEHQLLIWYI